MGAGLSIVRQKPLSKCLRMNSPRRVVILGPTTEQRSSASLLYNISTNVTSEELFVKNVHEHKLELPNLRVTLLDVDCPHHRKYYSMVKDYVRENSDGVMFVVDAAMHGEENQTNEDYILSEYMLNLEETQDGVLVVLVDRAEEEGAKSIEEIENQIRALLENQGRDRQRHAVFPIAAQAGTGLARALQWFADELNKTAMEGG